MIEAIVGGLMLLVLCGLAILIGSGGGGPPPPPGWARWRGRVPPLGSDAFNVAMGLSILGDYRDVTGESPDVTGRADRVEVHLAGPVSEADASALRELGWRPSTLGVEHGWEWE